jgi:hypothetical protein
MSTASSRIIDLDSVRDWRAAERGVRYVVLGDRALGRALVDAVVDIGADGTWTQTPRKEETRCRQPSPPGPAATRARPVSSCT